MNWLRTLYHKRQHSQLLKEKNIDFLKFKKDYEHSPLNEFYKNGERVFSRKELEYWKLIDIKNNNKISEALTTYIDFNKKYEKGIGKKPGKIIIGRITIKEKDRLFEIPMAVDVRTNELFFDVKPDKKENNKLENELFNWKPYQSEYVNFMIYEKLNENLEPNETLSFKDVSIYAKNDSYKEIMENIKSKVGKGVNDIYQIHNSQVIQNAIIEDKVTALRKENKELKKGDITPEKEVKKEKEAEKTISQKNNDLHI